jgi:chitin synthase
MSLETKSIVALVYGLCIIGLIFLIFLQVLGERKFNVTSQTTFYIKKWCLILSIILLNIGGCILVYYTQNLQVIIYIIVILKSKDIVMSVMFVFNMIYRAITKKYNMLPLLEANDESDKIISFIPTYDESEEQVSKTLDSVLNSKRGVNYILPVIVSDGKKDYDNLLDNIQIIKEYTYQSWKSKEVKLIVSFGSRKDKHVLSITKPINLGKKDSIIMIHDIFNYHCSNLSQINEQFRSEIRQDLLSIYGVDTFDYIFCTDGDTIINEYAIACLIDTTKKYNSIATCGIVNVDKSQGNNFWNNIQNFQYLYGQYIRRTNEDLFNQVLCLPGCISLIKVTKEFSDIIKTFSMLPNEKNLFECSVQHIGTDRRLTSSIVYTTTGARILQDTRAHAYTSPPQSLSSFFSQRNRWTHNMFCNSILNIFGTNVKCVSRLFNIIDVLRMSLVYFRLFNTLYFIYLLAIYHQNENIINLVPYIILLSYPVICFLVYSLFNSHLRQQFLWLVLFTIVNKVFTMLSTIITFIMMLFNIGNVKWRV